MGEMGEIKAMGEMKENKARGAMKAMWEIKEIGFLTNKMHSPWAFTLKINVKTKYKKNTFYYP